MWDTKYSAEWEGSFPLLIHVFYSTGLALHYLTHCGQCDAHGASRPSAPGWPRDAHGASRHNSKLKTALFPTALPHYSIRRTHYSILRTTYWMGPVGALIMTKSQMKYYLEIQVYVTSVRKVKIVSLIEIAV
ncbi:hypothetical protein Y032_0642g1030 [Ancylostoma ceylanicum]|uniref:Uncharacterized protein n=1 Tax=Ancylostoma ceylanicum TaxID=53326 RepID=A0A016WJB2_9BILA|nr:hypothetical protein Y032_0642g1030 [Ancylostoma ceylanicum]